MHIRNLDLFLSVVKGEVKNCHIVSNFTIIPSEGGVGVGMSHYRLRKHSKFYSKEATEFKHS